MKKFKKKLVLEQESEWSAVLTSNQQKKAEGNDQKNIDQPSGEKGEDKTYSELETQRQEYITGYNERAQNENEKFFLWCKSAAEKDCVNNRNVMDYFKYDAHKINPELYPKPQTDFLYKLKTSSKCESEKKNIVDQLIIKNSWVDSINQNERYKYTEHDLSKPPYNYKCQDGSPMFKKSYVLYSNSQDTDCEAYFKEVDANFPFGEVKRGSCNRAIDLIHLFSKKDCKMDPSKLNSYKKHIVKCYKQKNFALGGFDNKYKELINIPSGQTYSLAGVNLNESINLKSRIHESLVKIKENKTNQLLEQNILKNRVDFVLESFKKDKNTTKLIDNLIREFKYMSNQGYNTSKVRHNDKDSSILYYLHNRIGGDTTDKVLCKLIIGLAKRLGGDENTWWVRKVINNIRNNEVEADRLMALDCGYVTNLISDAFEQGLKTNKIESMGDDKVTHALSDSFNQAIEGEFKVKLFSELTKDICPILADFSMKKNKIETDLINKLIS